MDGRIRHDIRHPVATISMIASTMAVFEGNLDGKTLSAYCDQVRDELTSLIRTADEHGVALELDDLAKAVDRFVLGLPQASEQLNEACQGVIAQITEEQG